MSSAKPCPVCKMLVQRKRRVLQMQNDGSSKRVTVCLECAEGGFVVLLPPHPTRTCGDCHELEPLYCRGCAAKQRRKVGVDEVARKMLAELGKIETSLRKQHDDRYEGFHFAMLVLEGGGLTAEVAHQMRPPRCKYCDGRELELNVDGLCETCAGGGTSEKMAREKKA